MSITSAKFYSPGIFVSLTAELDEITNDSVSFTPSKIYCKQYDEVTIDGNKGMQIFKDGTLKIKQFIETGVDPFTQSFSVPTINENELVILAGQSYDITPLNVPVGSSNEFSITDGVLPNGLSFDSATGTIYGTAQLSALLLDNTQLQLYSNATNSITPLEFPGGIEPLTFTITNGTLPSGLTLDSSTGTISGTLG